MDQIEKLIETLNQEIPEVIFDRDALDVARPEDWGALEMRGDGEDQWADDQPVDTVETADLFLGVGDRKSCWRHRIEAALKKYDEETAWIRWSLQERAWQPVIQKSLWRWRIAFLEPMGGEEDAGEAEEDGEG